MDIEREPEIAAIFEGEDVPPWVVSAADLALGADPHDASAWVEALALALGRRANRLLRERSEPSGDPEHY